MHWLPSTAVARPRRASPGPRPALGLALGALVLATGIASARPALAEDCPDNVPAAARERRPLAKEWFSRAEAADAAGDPIGAVRAYQCSLKMVPHAFTAFNLGRLAERTGDLELAVDAFDEYIKLAPEAPDRAEIEAKIAGMRGRISALRAEQAPPPVVSTHPTPPPPPIEVKAPSPTPESGLVQKREPPPEPSSLGTVAPWLIGGGGAVALVAGLVLNIGARGKMDDCRSLAATNQLDAAASSCDAAKPRAYASYALFGVAAAAAVTDVILIVTSQAKEPRQVAVSPLPGGAAVIGRLRF
jgi:tetratricopeptide (TPR) repeat protein